MSVTSSPCRPHMYTVHRWLWLAPPLNLSSWVTAGLTATLGPVNNKLICHNNIDNVKLFHFGILSCPALDRHSEAYQNRKFKSILINTSIHIKQKVHLKEYITMITQNVLMSVSIIMSMFNNMWIF